MEVDSPGSSESTSGFPQLSRPAACQGYSSTDVENNTFHFVLICLILSVFVFKQTSDTNTFPASDKYNSRLGQIQSVFSQRQGGGCEAVVQTARHIPIQHPTPSTSPRPVLKMILQMRTFLIIMYRNGRYFSRCPAAVGGRSLFRPTPSSHCKSTAQCTHISTQSTLQYCMQSLQVHTAVQQSILQSLQTAKAHIIHGALQPLHSAQEHTLYIIAQSLLLTSS